MEFYTDQILDDNFHRIITFESDVLDTIQNLTTLAERTEIRLNVLEKLSSRPVTVKNSKLLILSIMGISFYAGHKYAEKKIKEEFYTQDLLARKHEAEAKPKTDHAKPGPKVPPKNEVKINGSNDPRPES